MTDDRALFQRLPRLGDLVPFVALADGLPTPVERVEERLWLQRDDRTDSRYGGNKVRKLEHLLALARRRGGPVLTAGGTGSHHVVATAVHAGRLGLSVEAVRFPQPRTADVARAAAVLDGAGGLAGQHSVPHPYAMPVGLAARLIALARRRPTLVVPGGSTPLGILGYVGAGLELVEAFRAAGDPPPDEVVTACGSGGTAVGMAVGLALGGWRRTTVRAVRVADAVVTNQPVLRGLEVGVRGLLALGGLSVARVGPARLRVDGRWFGAGYGHPTEAGERATAAAADLGLTLDPTYTAKAFAAALDRVTDGRRVAYVHTFAG